MAVNINSVSPTTGYFSGQSRSATISFTDTAPIYMDNGVDLDYGMFFRLYTASSGGTLLGQIGSYYTTVPYPGDSTFSATITITLTMPSGLSAGTYYVSGATTTGLRKAITISENTATLSFNLNGGSGTTPSNIVQTSGSSFTLPNSSGFYRTGYSSLNWNTSSAGTGTSYNFGSSYVFSANTTLYVKWQINQYTISFNSNGGSAVTAITQNYGTTVTQPSNPTKTGYTFAGWYSDSGLTNAYTFSTMPAENITLYAKWTINQYTLSFEENGGSTVTDITQNYATSVSAPTPPNKTGYSFGGWYTDVGLTTTYTFSTMPAYNQTIYAKWNINQYNVKFMNGSATISSSNLNYNTEITEPSGTPTKTDATHRYFFIGWNTDSEAIEPLITLGTVPANDITFYAIYISYISGLKLSGADVNIKIGSDQVIKIYKGTELIWEDYNE